MQNTKNIIVAPLNWGLGHATRCIPVIKALQKNGFTPILASDGGALLLLQKEFPGLETIALPSYGIQYPKNEKYFALKLLLSLPKILRAVYGEQKIIADLVKSRSIDGVISDNRFGVRNKNVPSVYMTHQLQVLSGWTTFVSSKIHQFIIKKFDECWVPDIAGVNNFSGKLGHLKRAVFPVKYIGVLSRFQVQQTIVGTEGQIDFLVILSGPEPQRTLLEEKLLTIFKNTSQKVVFVLGKMSSKQTCKQIGNVTVYNFMLSAQLSKTIQQSELVISRSGYTTIMDLVKLNKKAFFIPTPGQFEQQYLAERLQKLQLVPYASQGDFCLKDLVRVKNYKGLRFSEADYQLKKLFVIFK